MGSLLVLSSRSLDTRYRLRENKFEAQTRKGLIAFFSEPLFCSFLTCKSSPAAVVVSDED